jgi:hypothetical protein
MTGRVGEELIARSLPERNAMSYPVTVLSFGYLHPWPEEVEKPAEDDVYDLREKLFDPAHVPGERMRDLTGLDDDGLCGDCISGRCHWGGERSRLNEATVQRGGSGEHCGCARHAVSAAAREQSGSRP